MTDPIRCLPDPGSDQWAYMLDGIRTSDLVIFDLETSGLSPLSAKIAGCAVRVNGWSFYVPRGHEGLSARNVSEEAWLELCEALNGVRCVNHNIKFDIKFLQAQYGCRPLIRSDTQVLAAFTDSNQKIGLKPLAKKWLGRENRTSLVQAAGKSKNACLAPIESIAPYACEDVEDVEGLFALWGPKWENTFLHKLEIGNLEKFIDVELRGVRVDALKLREIEKQYKNELAAAMQKAQEMLGSDVNLSAPRQVAEAFKSLGLYMTNFTDGGEVSVSQKALKGVEHPAVEAYFRYKKAEKLNSTYAEGMWKHIHEGVIHPHFKTVHASTGRMSCEEPNLQNQPKKGAVRSIFIARPGYYLAESDFAQVELRVLASEAKARVWLKAFNDDIDVHRYLAGFMLSKDWKTIVDDERQRIKACSFGVVFGLGKYGLARNLGISPQEAQDLLNRFFALDPAIEAFIKEMIRVGREEGIIYTKFGRPRIIEQGLDGIGSMNKKMRAYWEHTCVNTKIQGTAADINKIAFLRVSKQGKRHGFFPLITVHDSILCEVPDSIPPEEHRAMMEEAMVFPIEGYCKMAVDYEYGKNWAEMRALDEPEVEQAEIDFATVRDCSACPVRKEAAAPVPPQQVKSKIMVVGRNPDRQEDSVGVPFVKDAPAGKMLTEWLAVAGLDRDKLWITNTLKCYTTMNRAPTAFERKTCAARWLDEEIKAVAPTLIIACGADALMQVMDDELLRISDVRGSTLKRPDGVWVFPMFHPAAMVRNPEWKRLGFEEDAPALNGFVRKAGLLT